jgi:hypothetical protein
MTETPTRDRVVAYIEAERAWWRDLVEEIGEERMTEPGPMGEWTFKDLAAHLLGWRERTIGRLEAAAAGRETPPSPWPAELDGDDDSVNDWIHERSRDRSVREVLDDVDRSYDRLAKSIAAIPEEVLTRPGALDWLGDQSLADLDPFSHVHDEHEPSIRAWLATGA